MEPVIYNRKSWHYRLATVYGRCEEWNCNDICSYTTACISGLMTILAIIVFGSVILGIPFADFIGWAAAVFNAGKLITMDSPAAAFASLMLTGILIVVLLGVGFRCKKLAESGKIRHLSRLVKPAFINDAYYSWKEKTCFQIKFVDKDESNV